MVRHYAEYALKTEASIHPVPVENTILSLGHLAMWYFSLTEREVHMVCQ